MYAKATAVLLLAATAAAQQVTSTAVATVVATSSVQAGQTLSNGAYVCNPAHQYPSGQTCVDGPTPTLATIATASSSSPKAGETLSNGAYVCNPAHQYPSGQSCVDGPTPTLATLTGAATTVVATSTSSSPKAGETLSNGGYVCNPAHQYPSGQTCVSGPTPTLSTIATNGTWATSAASPVATFHGGAVSQHAQPALLMLSPLLLAFL